MLVPEQCGTMRTHRCVWFAIRYKFKEQGSPTSVKVTGDRLGKYSDSKHIPEGHKAAVYAHS